MDYINVVAIIISPIVAVLIGQFFQNREKKRTDKMAIFSTLMYERGLSWSIEKVKALNVIEMVFSDDKSVLEQWKKYRDKLFVENPSDVELSKIKVEGDKLLEVMAKSLGYKDTITWETIQTPYIPNGMVDNMFKQQQYQEAQLMAMNQLNEMMKRPMERDNTGTDN